MIRDPKLLAGNPDPDSSPFESPSFTCHDCGRTDDHTYCIRWMERLHLWFARRMA